MGQAGRVGSQVGRRKVAFPYLTLSFMTLQSTTLCYGTVSHALLYIAVMYY